MPLKHLEHDGGEDFIQSETNFAKSKEKKQQLEPTAKEKLKEELQEEWLSLENPLLWRGDI